MVSTKARAISITFLITLFISTTSPQVLSLERNGTHTFGIRINNDRLLYRVENLVGNEGFYNFMFVGPGTAPGPEITCVNIVVREIFNETRAYISSGGIGEKSIVIVLTLLHKTKFYYEASIYGL